MIGITFCTLWDGLLGTFGIILMMVLMLFAVMSTGAGQVISIASLVIYDIYMPYLRPFHEDHKKGHCFFCNLPYNQTGSGCQCGSMRRCFGCKHDDGVIRDAADAGQFHKYT